MSQSARSEDIEWLPSVTIDAFHPAEVTATTSSGSGSIDLNTFLGANRYYNHSTSITGQGTITYNLEAGHAWASHETLGHVTQFFNTAGAYGGGPVGPLVDRHATAVSMLIGGRPTLVGPQPYQSGIAPGTNLRSAAVAQIWTGTRYSLSWGLNGPVYYGGLNAAFNGTYNGATVGDPSVRSPDVINSSIGITGPFTPASGSQQVTTVGDALAWRNPYTTWVNSTGNSGPATNTVASPASGYNTISVGALTKGSDPNALYDTVATFSSRGPQDFLNHNGTTWVTVAGVRAAVDITAPGDEIKSAYYGGISGGNHEADSDLTGPASGILGTSSSYSDSLAGTSYAAPLVAGGATLITSAARTLAGMSSNPDARQSVVVKSLLLSGADKTAGWTNNLQSVTVGPDTFLRTTQSLDWAAGAGRMNLDRTFELQTTGTMDVPGTTAGLVSVVDPIGWDYGKAVVGASSFNDYVFSTPFDGLTEFNTTLSWQRYRTAVLDASAYPLDYDDLAQADLNVSFWSVTWSGSNWQFTDKIAESSSLYNVVEHLSFQVPATGRYGLRVSYPSNTFDRTAGDVWGSIVGLNDYSQPYGLAWSVTAIPEPSAMFPHAALLATGLILRNRRSRKALPRQ